jgi:hypothetical protein
MALSGQFLDQGGGVFNVLSDSFSGSDTDLLSHGFVWVNRRRVSILRHVRSRRRNAE